MEGYFNKREVLGIALFRAGACALQDGTKDLHGRLEELGLLDELTLALDVFSRAEKAALETCQDEDVRIGIERRIDSYRIGLTYAKPECKQLHIVDDRDMQLLMGHALNFCNYECPCVVVGDDGDRVVIREAVKGCEMRKAYKRMMLSEGQSAECPYSMLI